jgi:hypothetical protein
LRPFVLACSTMNSLHASLASPCSPLTSLPSFNFEVQQFGPLLRLSSNVLRLSLTPDA